LYLKYASQPFACLPSAIIHVPLSALIHVLPPYAPLPSNPQDEFISVVGHELRTPLNAIIQLSIAMVNNFGKISKISQS
jgi:signal transduction histidine kinase